MLKRAAAAAEKASLTIRAQPSRLGIGKPNQKIVRKFSSRKTEAQTGEAKSSPAKELDKLGKRILVCVRCPLHQSRTMAVPGEGKTSAKVMIVGEGPGKQEDQTGRPFVGNAGRYLEHVLEGSPFTRDDFFITNVVKCRPPANRTPRTEEIDTCTSLY